MSSMLEQAIIDAAALREAALKNAEQAIIEKYAPEIKSAVSSLLNEDEGAPFTKGMPVRHRGHMARVTVESDEAGMVGIQHTKGGKSFLVQEAELEEANESDILEEQEGEEDVLGGEEDGLESNIEIPHAAMPNDATSEDTELEFTFNYNDFVDEAGDLVIDLDTIKLAADADPDSGGDEPLDLLGGGEEGLLDIGGAGGGDLLSSPEPAAGGGEEATLQELVNLLNTMDENEKIEEELVVDTSMQKNGWNTTDEGSITYEYELELARQESTKYKEENEALMKRQKKLSEGLTKLQNQNKEYAIAIGKINEKLQETLVSNAKLLYSNRVLSDASLNERQKNKIVEAISKARSVEEAKTLQETLKATVGSTRKKGPQSLSESIQRKSNLSSMINRRQKETKQDASFSQRMKKLAGIN